MAAVCGVLALQGSFAEHISCMNSAGKGGIQAVEVRTAAELEECAGLIIPGGESTTMALLAGESGLLGALREFATSGKPIWGTCAGLIFLAAEADGQKEGGQLLLQNLDVKVARNFFGKQVRSFEATLPSPEILGGDSSNFRAIFIRAPAIVRSGEGVDVLSVYTLNKPVRVGKTEIDSVTVAVKQGNLLATAFHPELTDDFRWHALFARMIAESKT